MDILERVGQAVMKGKWRESPQVTQEALDAGCDPQAILKVMIDTMDTVGEEFRVANMFIPEVLVSAKAMKDGMEILRPLLSSTDMNRTGTVVIGTVQGDMHDVGKSLVAMLMEGAGFEVHDLGVDVSATSFVEAVKAHNSDIVGMSSLLTTTVPFMLDTIRSLEEAGLRESVKVLVGGAPVTPEFAESIGADGYAPDAPSAVSKARELVGKAQPPPMREKGAE
jgi:corrinoid protein of di/trimethylamine methyltransferase